ncbi:hypothetical protein J2S00_001685 [Caldalkalibacillus uzonensis]|uniref:Uncharacterized protein n=1 Tax=Caldalkalibacillus uzonensis TaxID=353224 RepID=A0ABU0CSR3_9BACI|nr:hypothetical protein [Caldalkalibacillus uzonensis]MDQ0338899.1 hypothetical protein [Caldalkalibacillus uzonensis]
MAWLAQNLLKILTIAFIMLCIQLIAVVLASRFGLFIWLLKRIFAFRARVLKKEADEKKQSSSS